MSGISKLLVVAETKEEIEKFDLSGLKNALTKEFGSRGLEFKLRRKSPEHGVADVIAFWHPGFAMFSGTTDRIVEFVQRWTDEHATDESEVRSLPDD